MRLKNSFVCSLSTLNTNNYFVHMFKIKPLQMCQIFLAHPVNCI
jgi:hypothetical protein